MKKTTNLIIEQFPNLKKLINEQNKQKLDEESLKRLNETQLTFFRLGCFFENPDEFPFELGELYKHLNNEYLEWALELITTYFRKDTYLIQEPKYLIIRDTETLLNQSQLAEFLTEKGLRYDRHKINLYYGRGTLFEPSIVIGGVKYWDQSEAENFAESEKKRIK